MRSCMLFLLSVTPALADLPIDEKEERERRPALEQFVSPCFMPKVLRPYVVTWWIEDKHTGERRDLGAQEVRPRC